MYQSYLDFWRLVELSGFRTCYVDEIDLRKDEVYITTPVNGETRPHIRSNRSKLTKPQEARIVVWMLERPNTQDINGGVRELSQYSDAVWISDAWMARRSKEIAEAEGGPHYTFAELGSHPGLSLGPRGQIYYDVAHLSYTVPRREAIYKALSAFGYRVAPNAWGSERDNILRSTRAILNIHQDDNKLIVEPLRMAVAAAYELPYLSEISRDPYPLIPGKTLLHAPYNDLTLDLRKWLSSDALNEMGHCLYERLCVHSNFRNGVMEALYRTFAE